MSSEKKEFDKLQSKIKDRGKEAKLPVEIYKLLPLNKDDINKVLMFL